MDDSAAATELPATEMPATETPKGLTVAKPFHTHQRRFKSGDAIKAEDVAGSALDLLHLKSRGFVA